MPPARSSRGPPQVLMPGATRPSKPEPSCRALWPPARVDWRWMAIALACALVIRVSAAFLIESLARRSGRLDLFDDTNVYWHLASRVLSGDSYEVRQFGVPHFALRVPGYPVFLASLRQISSDAAIFIRLVQAVLAVWSILLQARIVDRIAHADPQQPLEAARPAAILTAFIAAFEPWSAGMSALLLSEALFVPLVVSGLYGLAVLAFPSAGDRAGLRPVWCVAQGALHGAAILTRPSWALFPPIALLGFVLSRPRGQKRRAGAQAALVLAGISLIMLPWWARNAAVFGRFVPTALWFGASLYDGLHPGATGASDMAFLADPRYVRLDETTQDRVLRDDALSFAASNPVRVIQLAMIKAGRYWSPWPNADELGSAWARIGSAFVVIPLYGLILIGAFALRRQRFALLLLIGPLLYFAAIHMAFVGSMRYRIPASFPAFGLAGIGLGQLLFRRQSPPAG